MTTAVDTNVFVALLAGTERESSGARRSLQEAREGGALVISAPVHAELSAAPGRDMGAVDAFLSRARVEVDWDLDEETWRAAARAFGNYAERRRTQRRDPGPQRILADFVIGAHALRYASALLTLDQGIYRAAFPELEVLTPE